MHELWIANQVLSAARQKLQEENGPAGTVLRVRIGLLSGVNVDTLRFCFDTFGQGPDCAFDVVIASIKPMLLCDDCGEVELPGRFDTSCPRCGGTASGFAGGRDIEAELEFDDQPQEVASNES